ncbi:hypothetical protein L6452_39565 [Arctium lappa]|uniref:Uncharacterized protein n=1 Tax=Arctium lappa TaxID=4217 RepID=A0ACB8XSN4_ARCLA|nr:hypothetical protein L6452_39565 [Arctium lappa]
MSVIEYETQFNQKARFALRFLSSEHERIEHFVDGLRREIREFVANRDIPSFNKAVEYARRREHDLTILDEPNFQLKRQRNERTFSLPTHKSPRFFTPRRTQTQTTSRAPSQAYTLQPNAPQNCQKCGKSRTSEAIRKLGSAGRCRRVEGWLVLVRRRARIGDRLRGVMRGFGGIDEGGVGWRPAM